jgi:hypothetical protein
MSGTTAFKCGRCAGAGLLLIDIIARWRSTKELHREAMRSV